uniref:Uncharacterized protein n=1 Tax=Cannabis sativa TaxID=3483 RepID=A0A803QK98_CANSA
MPPPDMTNPRINRGLERHGGIPPDSEGNLESSQQMEVSPPSPLGKLDLNHLTLPLALESSRKLALILLDFPFLVYQDYYAYGGAGRGPPGVTSWDEGRGEKRPKL